MLFLQACAHMYIHRKNAPRRSEAPRGLVFYRPTLGPIRLATRSRTKLSSNLIERCICFGTDRTNCNQADNDDQSKHNCVLNSRWTIFRNQEILNFVYKTLHQSLQLAKPRLRINKSSIDDQVQGTHLLGIVKSMEIRNRRLQPKLQ